MEEKTASFIIQILFSIPCVPTSSWKNMDVWQKEKQSTHLYLSYLHITHIHVFII